MPQFAKQVESNSSAQLSHRRLWILVDLTDKIQLSDFCFLLFKNLKCIIFIPMPKFLKFRGIL